MDEVTKSSLIKLIKSTDSNNWKLALEICRGISNDAESIIYDYIKEVYGTEIEPVSYYELEQFIIDEFESLGIYTKFKHEIKCQIQWFERTCGLNVMDVTRIGRIVLDV